MEEGELTPEDLLSIEELIQILDVPRSIVESWMGSGVLKPVQTGEPLKFRFEDVRLLAQKYLNASQRNFRILVVEDDPLVGNSLKNLLEKSGYEAQVVPLGLVALDVASGQNFDLILADVRMPGMNGIETLKAIRELRTKFGKRRVPEIIITAYEDEAVREEAARMDISDFILKPFELKDLISVIERHLQHAA